MKQETPVGEFVSEKILSKGGMSNIHLAHVADQPNYKVVLKVHQDTQSDRNIFQDLLRVEADYLVRFRHPNVVRIYPLHLPNGKTVYSARAVFLPEQPWYFAMEYIRGSDLSKYVKSFSKFPIPWIIELFYQLLITVQYIHKMGYGHCDLKPENVLMREPPDPTKMPLPVLTDFGTAQQTDAKITRPARSIRYSPPEVIMAYTRKDMNPTDFPLYPTKIDIWSLGAILFELLTGQHLFNQNKEVEITSSILRGELKKIQEIRPEVNESLDRVISVMLHRHPVDRPDIDDIIEAIETRISSVRPPRIPNA